MLMFKGKGKAEETDDFSELIVDTAVKSTVIQTDNNKGI